MDAPTRLGSRVRGNDEPMRGDDGGLRGDDGGRYAPSGGSPSPLPSPTEGRGGNSIGYRVWDFWVRRSWLLWVLAVLVIAFDQSTKALIVGWLDWGQSWPEEGFLRFTHARNTGTAFSLFQGHSNVLSFVAIFAVGVLLWVYATTGAKSFILRVALGLQLGGAIGNLLDRLQQGYVTDFLDVGWWPIFNVADSAISVGMVLMVYYFFVHREESEATATVATIPDDFVAPIAGCRRCAASIHYGRVHHVKADVTETEI